MIDEDRTMQLYGYTSDELKPQSNKPIIAVCEECGKYRVLRKQNYHDLCASCAAGTMETRQKKSDAHKGKTFSPKHCLKLSDAHRGKNCGDKNPNWKGGVTPIISRIRESQIYKNWRTAVYTRDNFTCQMCGDDKGANLQAHHIQPVRDHKNDLLLYDIGNGITLCKDCHQSIKGREHTFIDRFYAIVGVM